MSDEEKRKETYERIKKRLEDYRYRSALLQLGTMGSAVLLILSVFPIVPILVMAFLPFYMSGNWLVPLWFTCIGVFFVLFWLFQRFSMKIEQKRGITLEEKMYVPAYEALCHFKEYSDPDHPIMGSKLKAERRMRYILTLLAGIALPNVTIVREEAIQLWQLWNNLKTRLTPSMRRDNGNVHSLLVALVDYLSKPELASLVALNIKLVSLPEIVERDIYLDVRSAFFKRSNLRHITMFSVFAIFGWFVYYIDINYFSAPTDTAFGLGLTFWLGIAAIYVTYLGLTARRELRT